MSATRVFKAFDRELSGPVVAALSGALLGAAAWLSVTLSDRLGLFFGVCLVLAALTAALVVNTTGLFAAGVLPPLLLLTVVIFVVIGAPAAVDVARLTGSDGAPLRVIAGVVDQATPLVIAHVAALTIIAFRVRTAALTSGPED
ncbi:hypothetical protein BH18ACT8_BH18ACT8_02370 [soil metagenome]